LYFFPSGQCSQEVMLLGFLPSRVMRFVSFLFTFLFLVACICHSTKFRRRSNRHVPNFTCHTMWYRRDPKWVATGGRIRPRLFADPPLRSEILSHKYSQHLCFFFSLDRPIYCKFLSFTVGPPYFGPHYVMYGTPGGLLFQCTFTTASYPPFFLLFPFKF